MKLFNTATQTYESLSPVNEGKVNMYVCGPTVYNYFHIGNARVFVFFDVARRYLEKRGYAVNYVQNFTDIDDKLIEKANAIGTTVKQLSEEMIEAYYEDARALGVKDADFHPKATEHIKEMIDAISKLIQKDLAYETEKDVYFNTDNFSDYGKLSGQDISNLQSGSRIDVDPHKKNPLDFVLWKKAKPGEPSWDSPWGKGRPGWHIECTAMSRKYLGDTLDIHAGGEDLAFPHHENEVAQSEGLTGKPFTKHWLHARFLQIDSKKMGKSLGNQLMVRDLLKKHPPLALRFFLLSAHYRNPLNYTEKLLQSAKSSVNRLNTAYQNLQHAQAQTKLENKVESLDILEEYRKKFYKAMDNDFNTADAISVLFEVVKEANNLLASPKKNGASIAAFKETIDEFDDILGLIERTEEKILDEEIEEKIQQRQQARAARDFATADRIRDELLEKGIALEDTPDGVRWKYIE
ncbi:cysteine--tRNA ligase [Proteinivorax hydrogeniformans]|uniref:Cysteine--tRNA ligase n=1 Tax=Proteinivorax hydrogeniformans TaxID=1826727 RepID=A0AAU8HX44_9FIRM